MGRPPTIENPAEAAEAQEILSRAPGTPRGHTDVTELREPHKEEVEPAPNNLDADYAWFIPGLAYCVVGMDKSLFELFSIARDQQVPVRTYRTSSPLVTMHDVDITGNPWFHTIQGIPQDLASEFAGFIETYRINDKIRGLSWWLEAANTRLADPFYVGGAKRGVDVTLFLPHSITNLQKITISKPAGLMLATPELKLVHDTQSTSEQAGS